MDETHLEQLDQRLWPHNDNVHRACPNIYDRYIEVADDGFEYTVPVRLLCRAPSVILKDKTLRWMPKKETERLHHVLNQTGRRAKIEQMLVGQEQLEGVEEILATAVGKGYSAVGVTYHSHDYGLEDEHYLIHSTDGMSVVVSANFVDEGHGLGLQRIETSTRDAEVGCHILRLESDEDIRLAKQKRLFCEDSEGAHTQVMLWRSVIWQCHAGGRLNAELLRGYWRKAVKAGKRDL